jgi:hypothetical protein
MKISPPALCINRCTYGESAHCMNVFEGVRAKNLGSFHFI